MVLASHALYPKSSPQSLSILVPPAAGPQPLMLTGCSAQGYLPSSSTTVEKIPNRFALNEHMSAPFPRQVECSTQIPSTWRAHVNRNHRLGAIVRQLLTGRQVKESKETSTDNQA